MPTEIDRKIAVIFVADVVGYSKHMEKDENATIKSYNACETILNKLLKKYKGSVFNTAGDSVLAEFPSAVNAVECGVDFQNEIKKRNQSDKTDVRLEFRLGINMGDVVKKEGNLIGDGVNIAARLEALAQPNGITISKSVYDFVVPKTKMTFNDLGVQKVKQNEFHAFDILLDPSQKRKLNTKPKSNMPLIGAIAAAVIIAFVGFFYFNPTNNNNSKVSKIETSSKPIILVAPIKASGLSDNQKGFANGITESMISTLTQYKSINVLSSSTSFHTQKIEMLDKDIRDSYGVDYIVRGSMQVMGNSARLNLEITDLKTEKVKVSKKKDFKLDEIFQIQDELSSDILKELQINLTVGSSQGKSWAKDLKSMEDFTLMLNWREEWRKFTRKGHVNSQRMLDELRSLYPGESRVMLVLESWQLSQKIAFGLSTNKDKDLERLSYILDRAIELDPHSADAFAARALIGRQRLNRSCEDSLADMIKAEEQGSTVDTLTIGGAVYAYCGDHKNAIKAQKSGLLLVPNDTGWFITSGLVLSLYRDGQIDEIYKVVGKNIEAEDMRGRVLAIYAFLEQEKGNIDKAKDYLERAKKNNFDRKRFERQFNPEEKDLLERTINGLLKIGSLE